MSPHWIDLDGVVNMRDLGGLPTTGGGVVRPGRLIRSDNLQDLTERDVHRLVDELGVTDILDLRTDKEVTVTGPGPLSATPLRHHHHSLISGDLEGPGAHGQERRGAADPTVAAGYWSQHYLGYLSARPDSVLAALEVVATSPGGTVVHCAAGKDRTGTVVGLALSVAGVAEDDIVADYVASAERIEAIMARLADREPYVADLAGQTVEDQRPHPESMVAILRALDDGYGGVGGWLTASGWAAGDVERLRTSLVG